MENKCQRCFIKKAIFNCPSCVTFHNLCQNCDEYIHSSNKTRSHKRYYINNSNKSPPNKKLINKSQNDNMNSSNNINIINNESQLNTSNFSNKKTLNTFPLNIESSPNNNSQLENSTPSFYKFQKYYNSSSKNSLNSPKSNIKKSQKRSNNKNRNRTNYNNGGVTSIKNQIEYIQKNMSDQINQVLLNLDKNNQNMNYQQQLDIIEKNYQDQINQLMELKNNEIENLKLEIKEENKTNETLMNEISRANEDNNVKVIELTNVINMLTDELNQKDEQLLTLKGNSQKNEININNDFDEEKNIICNEYENKINNILNIAEHNQQKLLNVIKEKDVIIQNLINCNQDKTNQFNEFIFKINENNKKLKNITQESIGLAKNNLVNSINNNDNNDNNDNNYN